MVRQRQFVRVYTPRGDTIIAASDRGYVGPDIPVEIFDDDLPRELAATLSTSDVVACDTETTGLDWQVDRLAICQFYAPEIGLVAIVRVGQTRPQYVRELLASHAVPKVFHHAPFDLRFLMQTFDVVPASVVCTKIAAKLLRPNAENREHSLDALVRRHLGVELDKGAVRTSDWTAELSGEQRTYAANDVRYLVPLLRSLELELKREGRERLFDACCAFLPEKVESQLLGLDDIFAY